MMSPISRPAGSPVIAAFIDPEEKDMIEAFETSESDPPSFLTPSRKLEIETLARATMLDERAKISLRVPKGDLVQLKSRALQEGIPYQTLINSLIHKYVWG